MSPGFCIYHGPYEESWCPHCGFNNQSHSIDSHANVLDKIPNAILYLDQAPDRHVRYIQITRKSRALDIAAEMDRYLGSNLIEIYSDHNTQRLIRSLEEFADHLLLNKNIFEVNIRGFNEKIYLSELPLAEIYPTTLLTQIIDAGFTQSSKPPSSREDQSNLERELATDIARHHSDEDFKKLQEKVEAKQHLALSLDKNDKYVISVMEKENNQKNLSYVNNIEDEDVSIFKADLFLFDHYAKVKRIELDYQKKDSHIKNLKKIIDENYKLNLKITRNDIAIAFISFLTRIQEQHSRGLIHCDIKPQNILSLIDGLIPIGSLDTKIGETSPGLTVDYAPPELILLRPVSPATDIYSLGLIILKLVNGVQYGRLSKYLIPIGRNRVKEIDIFESPDIYISYENSAIPSDGIFDWRDFLLKCFAFNPNDRHQNINIFKSTFEKLLHKHPLKGSISFNPSFGDLRWLEFENQRYVAWVISDQPNLRYRIPQQSDYDEAEGDFSPI